MSTPDDIAPRRGSHSRRSIVMAIAGLAVGGLMLWWTLRRVDLTEAWRHIIHVEPLWLLVTLAFGLLSIVIRGIRWQQIFRGGVKPTLGAAISGIVLGNFGNFLLPARAGDLLRCYLMRNNGAAMSTAAGALVVERLLDGMAALLILVVGVIVLDAPPIWFRTLSGVAAAIFCVALAMLIWLRRYSDRAIATLHAIARRLGLGRLMTRFDPLLRSFIDGVGVVVSPAHLLRLIALGLGIWIAEAIGIVALAAAVDIPLGIFGALVTAAVIGLGMMLPLAPGNIGSYEFFAVESFQMFGLAPSAALALAVVMHSWVYIIVLGLGLIFSIREGVFGQYLRRRLPIPEPVHSVEGNGMKQ